jgi:succinyl-diaminopimelate desuccinylase
MAHGAMPESGANPLAALAAFLVGCAALERALQAECGEHPYLGKPYLTPTALDAGSPAQMNVIPDTAVAPPRRAHHARHAAPDDPRPPPRPRPRVERDHPSAPIQIEVIEDRPPTATDPAEPLVAATVAAHEAEWGATPPFGGRPRRDRRHDPLARARHPDRHLRPRRHDHPPSGR